MTHVFVALTPAVYAHCGKWCLRLLKDGKPDQFLAFARTQALAIAAANALPFPWIVDPNQEQNT